MEIKRAVREEQIWNLILGSLFDLKGRPGLNVPYHSVSMIVADEGATVEEIDRVLNIAQDSGYVIRSQDSVALTHAGYAQMVDH